MSTKDSNIYLKIPFSRENSKFCTWNYKVYSRHITLQSLKSSLNPFEEINIR